MVVSLFVGATAGALLLIHAPMYAPALPFVITVAVVAAAAAVWWESEGTEGTITIRDRISYLVLRWIS
jgi:hypothetical protein